MASAVLIGDIFYEWGATTTDWSNVQQSFLSAADADTTDPYITVCVFPERLFPL